MSGGGKGGSSSTELPAYLQAFQQQNMHEANQLADLGYLPYTGPEVAAVNPWEEQAAYNQAQMSNAFNMGAPEGTVASRMPDVVTGPDGSQGYSSFPLFQQAVAEMANVAPEYDDRYRHRMNLPQNVPIYENRGGQVGVLDTAIRGDSNLAHYPYMGDGGGKSNVGGLLAGAFGSNVLDILS